MITPSGGITKAQFTEALLAGNQTHIQIVFPNQEVTLVDEDIHESAFQMINVLNGETDLIMGRAVQSEVIIPIINNDTVRGLVWTEEFEVKLGVEINGTTSWITVGYFHGKRPEKVFTADTVAFYAVDRMEKFDIVADEFFEGLTYPITLEDLYHQLCTYVGVSYVAGDELPGIMARSFTATPVNSNGATCREVLAKIAEAAGCYAKITHDGYCKLVWFEDHMDDVEVTLDNTFNLNVCELSWITDDSRKKKWEDLEGYTWAELERYLWRELEGEYTPFRVDGLRAVQTIDDIGVTIPSGTDISNPYLIIDNPFLAGSSENEIVGYITPILTRLQEFGFYIPVTVGCSGNCLVESGDIISVEVSAGTFARVPVFVKTLTWNGHLEDVYQATGNLEREPLTTNDKTLLATGGKFHRFKVSLDELDSEINDPATGLSTRVYQNEQNIELLAQTKKSVYVMLTDPAITEQVAEGDIWVRRKYESWTDIATNGGSWTALASDASSWAELATADSYYRLGSVWHKLTDNEDALISIDALRTKYDIQSGIRIEPEGIEIDGGKYIRMRSGSEIDIESGGKLSLVSGGALDVQAQNFILDSVNKIIDIVATNFSIDSANKRVKAGNFVIDDQSFRIDKLQDTAHVSNIHTYFVVGDKDTYDYSTQGYYSGILFDNKLYEYSSGGYVAAILPVISLFANNQTNAKLFNLLIESTSLTRTTIYDDTVGVYKKTDLGKSGYPFDYVYADNVTLKNIINANADGVGVIGASNKYFSDIYVTTVHSVSSPIYSSKEYKHDIKPMEDMGEKIDKLEPVTFVYDKDPTEKKRHGLIYEDVIEVIPDICTQDETDKGINYIELVPIMLKEMQEMRKRIKELEDRVATLEKREEN